MFGNYFLKCYIVKMISISFNCFSEYIKTSNQTCCNAGVYSVFGVFFFSYLAFTFDFYGTYKQLSHTLDFCKKSEHSCYTKTGNSKGIRNSLNMLLF